MENLLEIIDLHAGIEGKEILHGINLTVRPGEIHAVMGSLHKKYFCPEEADSFVDWMVDLGIRC